MDNDVIEMNRRSMRCFIAISFFLFCILSVSDALSENYWEESLSDSVILSTIVVSAKRVESQEGSSAENITVYSRQEIEKLSAKNLGEIIKYIPGVDISVTNQFGQLTALTIHGSNSRHVLLMVDGIPFNTQLSGQADPTMIPVEHIKRVEVIKGASSSSWGSSLGGVINVITKDVGDSIIPKGIFRSSFAEFGTTKNSLELAGKISKLGYFISGNYMETDGTKTRSDVKEKKIFGKISFPIADAIKIISSFGYSSANVLDGVNSDDDWDSTPYISRYGNIKLDINKNDLNLNIAYKYNDQDISSSNYDAATGALNSSTISSNTYQGISLNGSLNLRDNDVLVLGSDFDWHKLKSSNYLATGKRISMQAPYMNYTFNWDNWNFIPGVRFDNNRQFGSQTSPSLGVVYNFNDSGKSLIRAKISRAFNAPPLLWIYCDDPSVLVGPNPDLKAERAMVYEIGFETKMFSPVSIKLGLYHTDVKDAIATAFKDGAYIKDNFKKFRRQGVELFLNYEVNDDLTLYGGGAFTDVKNRETNEIVRDADIARQSFSLGANYKNKGGLEINLHGYYNRWSSNPGDANDRKFIFDANFSQKFKNKKDNLEMELFLNIYNLTNSKYWSNPTYPLPKRYFEGGMSLEF